MLNTLACIILFHGLITIKLMNYEWFDLYSNTFWNPKSPIKKISGNSGLDPWMHWSYMGLIVKVNMKYLMIGQRGGADQQAWFGV